MRPGRGRSRGSSLLTVALGLTLLTGVWAHASEPRVLVVPAIGSSKNDGVEGGVIVPILFGDADGRISQMVVPMFIRNQYVGSRATLNLFQYPHRGEDINVVGSYTEKIERKFVGNYRNITVA